MLGHGLRGAGAPLALLVRELDAPLALFGLLALLAAAPLVLRPELATLAVVFLLYTNIPVLSTYQGVPFVVASSFMLLLGVPLLHFVIARREPLRTDAILVLMLGFLAAMLVSALGAKGLGVAVGYIQTYVLEGLLLYWLVINTVRTRATLVRVLWALLAAGALLGGLTAYQEATGDFDQQFYGLAHRNVDFLQLQQMDPEDPEVQELLREFDGGRSRRAEGPMNEPNRYAQILLVLLPLALHLHRTAASRRARLAVLAAVVLVCCGIVFSNSRGALVGFVALAMLAGWIGWVSRSRLVLGALAVALLIPVAAPKYAERALSILRVTALAEGAGTKEADGAIRGRATEMLAAAQAFLDHPVLGVGPGQYLRFYSLEYQQKDPRYKFRDLKKGRRAHSLYVELPAELGMVGAVSFFAIFAVLLRRLLRARRHWLARRPELADLATAFAFSLVAWLVTSLFLHLSYQRYLWLLVGLASAALHVMRSAEHPSAAERAAAA